MVGGAGFDGVGFEHDGEAVGVGEVFLGVMPLSFEVDVPACALAVEEAGFVAGAADVLE